MLIYILPYVMLKFLIENNALDNFCNIICKDKDTSIAKLQSIINSTNKRVLIRYLIANINWRNLEKNGESVQYWLELYDKSFKLNKKFYDSTCKQLP